MRILYFIYYYHSSVADTQNNFETNDVNDATRDVDVTDNENLLA
jgi:hypothetical protein